VVVFLALLQTRQARWMRPMRLTLPQQSNRNKPKKDRRLSWNFSASNKTFRS
jgi:hypothetical protein